MVANNTTLTLYPIILRLVGEDPTIIAPSSDFGYVIIVAGVYLVLVMLILLLNVIIYGIAYLMGFTKRRI